MATEVVEPVVPPPSSGTDNLGREQAVTEAVASLVVTEPMVEAVLGGGDAVAASVEQIVPPPLPTRDHEAMAPSAMETPAPAEAQAGGGATEVSTTDTIFASILEIIDLDAPDLPSNDHDIYESVLERMLVDPVESGAEASGSAAPAAATSAEVEEPANEEPMSGAIVAGQLMPSRAGGVRGPETSIAVEAAEVVLGDPAANTELTLVVPSPPTTGVDSATVEALESSCLRPVALVDEAAPAACPSLPALQEHDAPGSVTGSTSLEIQETGEGSGAAQPPKP
jgi:hypothetical protein